MDNQEEVFTGNKRVKLEEMEDPTELHEAAWLGKHELLEHLLLDGQYDIDSEDWTYEKKTPLHVAVEAGDIIIQYHSLPFAHLNWRDSFEKKTFWFLFQTNHWTLETQKFCFHLRE